MMPPKQTLKGQVKKGPQVSLGEIDCLLEFLEEKIPVSGEEWDDIAQKYYCCYSKKGH